VLFDFRTGSRRRGIAAVVTALVGAALLASQAWAADDREPVSGSLFLGPIADHLLDRSGALEIVDAVAERNGAKFTPAAGRVANYGPRPTPKAAFWLRVTVPKLDGSAAREWVLTLNEPRTRRAVLYLESASGWVGREWLLAGEELGTPAARRYPTFVLAAADVSARTIFLRIETPSSLRALLWLEPEVTYIGGYAKQSTLFGVLFGILAALFVYMFAIGLMTREAAYLTLAALIFAKFCYMAGDRGFVEVVFLPGAVYLARVCSLGGSILTYAFSIAFAVTYMRIGDHFPRLAKLGWVLAAAIVVVAAVAADDIYRDISRTRFVLPYLSFTSFGLIIGLGLLVSRRETGRAIAFLLCWSPAIAGSLSRSILDVYPEIGAAPIVVNATYLANGVSLLLMAIVTSFDLQRRERRLRETAQASEDRFRSFAGAASDAFWETDARGQVLFQSGPAGEFAGIASGQSFAAGLRRNAVDAARPELLQIANAMRLAQPFRSVPLSFSTGAGDIRHILLSGAPVRDGKDELLGFRGIASDVTELRNRREREAQQQKMAAVGQLAGGIAHEINNLLHPIINLSRRVAGEFPTRDERRRYLDIVIDAGVRAGEIVAGVLATVRPDVADTAMAPLAEAVRRAAESIRPVVPDAVRFEVEIASDGGPQVGCGEVLQVLTNLVANAIYATGGSGQITVTLAAEAASHVLSVRDDGQGMDAETRQRALEPFFTTKDVGQGTGLGLSIVYGIVRGWGGSIDIESEPGRGSRIVIRVPAPESNVPKSMADHGRITA
jgi:PAS domain S-box-containing protein